MERNARDFYARAARHSKTKQGKRMFDWLAQFEVGHKTRLESKKQEILQHPALEGVDVPKLDDYQVSEASGTIVLSDDPTDIEILKIAIENEKRAYSFFQKKITFTEDTLLLRMFETMAREEEKHWKILQDQLDRLQMDNIWGTMDEIEQTIKEFDGKDHGDS
jgi:rubrerythrin